MQPLKDQGADFEPTQLYAQRMALRPEKTTDEAHRIQSAYGEKYDPLVMFDSKHRLLPSKGFSWVSPNPYNC